MVMLFEASPCGGEVEHGLSNNPPQDGPAEKDRCPQRGGLAVNQPIPARLVSTSDVGIPSFASITKRFFPI